MRNFLLTISLLCSGSMAHADIGERAVDAVKGNRERVIAAAKAEKAAQRQAEQTASAAARQAKQDLKRASNAVYAKLASLSKRPDVQALRKVLAQGKTERDGYGATHSRNGLIFLAVTKRGMTDIETKTGYVHVPQEALVFGPSGFGLQREPTQYLTSTTHLPRRPLKMLGLFKRSYLGALDMNAVEKRLSGEVAKLGEVVQNQGTLPYEWTRDPYTTWYQLKHEGELKN